MRIWMQLFFSFRFLLCFLLFFCKELKKFLKSYQERVRSCGASLCLLQGSGVPPMGRSRKLFVHSFAKWTFAKKKNIFSWILLRKMNLIIEKAWKFRHYTVVPQPWWPLAGIPRGCTQYWTQLFFLSFFIKYRRIKIIPCMMQCNAATCVY